MPWLLVQANRYLLFIVWKITSFKVLVLTDFFCLSRLKAAGPRLVIRAAFRSFPRSAAECLLRRHHIFRRPSLPKLMKLPAELQLFKLIINCVNPYFGKSILFSIYQTEKQQRVHKWRFTVRAVSEFKSGWFFCYSPPFLGGVPQAGWYLIKEKRKAPPARREPKS